MEKIQRLLTESLLLLLLLCFEVLGIAELKKEAVYRKNPDTETFFAAFRSMDFMTGYEEGQNKEDFLFALMEQTTGAALEDEDLEKYKKYHPDFFEKYEGYLNAVWNDLVCFPVPESSVREEATVNFVNSWLADRTFGGKRGHEGCDIMAAVNERGLYPVVSVSDGTVEKIGWLEKGGYRIGIRSESGAYFYYAHLSDYSREFLPGEQVSAGELLGFMGDSGYGAEGTVGMFDVHLHFGIYLNDEKGEEFSVNSYYALKFLESKKQISEFG